MIDQSPILITGCARSGASMIAKVINMCGAFGGAIADAKGMYGNTRLFEKVVKPYLIKIGADWAGQYPLPDVNGLLIPKDWGERVSEEISNQGHTLGQWMYKDNTMCLIWPVWHYAFPNARWIIVRRRTGDIIQSCMKTGYMKAFNSEGSQMEVGVSNEHDGWLWWVHQHEQRFVEMITEGLNCKVVWPQRMVYGDYKQLYETLDWLGLKWQSDVLNFIDPLLLNSRQKERRTA